MPTYWPLTLMTPGLPYWSVSGVGHCAVGDGVCVVACGVAHQVLDAIQPRGDNILIQGTDIVVCVCRLHGHIILL